MLRDAALVAGKDLRIEVRSRVATNQVLPFALMVLLLFAFALDPDRGTLRAATPGLFWVAVLFVVVIAVQRSAGLEAADGARETLLPLLLLPVVAPVLIGATRATEAALGTGGTATSDGWPWVGLLGVFAVAYTAAGLLAFGPLLEDA